MKNLTILVTFILRFLTVDVYCQVIKFNATGGLIRLPIRTLS